MSDYKPYDGYEPNEPTGNTPDDPGFRPLAPAGAFGAQPGSPAERTPAPQRWEEAGYTPNEPDGDPADTTPDAYAAYAENRYIRPTWDESTYLPEPAASPRRRRTRAAVYDAPEEAPAAEEEATADVPAYPAYQRPQAEAEEAMAMSARFAPPLKFELPPQRHMESTEGDYYAAPATPTLYQTRKPAAAGGYGAGFDPAAPAEDYRVEAEGYGGRRSRRGRGFRRFLIVLCVLAVLGGAAYFGRDYLLQQVRNLFGTEAAESVNQAVNQAIGGGVQQPTAAYDPAPAVQVSDRARQGIAAVAGGVDLAPYAVTARNVVARRQTADGLYEYYLFAAADGRLLGYYEGLGENDFLVCADDIYYVPQPPYLIDAEGLPLIDASRYQQAAGADAVLGPMTGGWAIIRNAVGTASNYVKADGSLLSALWFAKAWPFTAGQTLAWVDTGNVTEPEERYALYTLARTGEMKLWKHAADMDGVLGCAAGVAVMAGGEVVRLDAAHTSLCVTDDAAVYADCGALVARDPATGKYALFVGGEQHYDFAYDRIAPVPSDIQWAERANGLYRELTVTGMAYPLPLSHYFALEKDGAKEMVALSTGSVYPLRLQ